MNRRLDDARCSGIIRGILAGLDLPEGGTWEVTLISGWVEDDVGKETVLPLATEEGIGLTDCFSGVIVRIAHGDESGIPRPLMRVEIGRWEGGAHLFDPVAVENGFCSVDDVTL